MLLELTKKLFYDLKITDISLTLFTGALAVYTYRLWRSTDKIWDAGERQLNHVKESAQRQLRAYISAKDVNVVLLRLPGTMGAYGPIEGPVHTYSTSIVLNNSGDTPARHMVVCANWQCFYDGIPDNFDCPDTGVLKNVYCGLKSEILIGPYDIPAHAMTGATDILIWGWAEYNDAFKDSTRRRTEFCFRAELRVAHGVVESLIGFTFYGRFNAADDDCLRKPQTQGQASRPCPE